MFIIIFLQIRHKLTPIFGDPKASLDVIAFTALSLGLVFVGSCNEDVAQTIIFALMDRSESDLGEPLARLLCLGLGLLYLGKQVFSLWHIFNLNELLIDCFILSELAHMLIIVKRLECILAPLKMCIDFLP